MEKAKELLAKYHDLLEEGKSQHILKYETIDYRNVEALKEALSTVHVSEEAINILVQVIVSKDMELLPRALSDQRISKSDAKNVFYFSLKGELVRLEREILVENMTSINTSIQSIEKLLKYREYVDEMCCVL